jgi:hypothetical protein
MAEIPVYLFTGFLEAGKTKFIQGTLEDRRFNTGERTLLLLCEEGIEEYDPSSFSGKNVYFMAIQAPEELTTANLEAAQRKYKASRVVVEYNGMWLLKDLMDRMPQDWVIYQNFFFADSNTILNFNANMRSLVVDKLQTCELVVFNRFTQAADKMALHKLVRGVSRRTDIVYEQENGDVEYDEIKDPLPFDINAPVIEIADRDYALWYRDMVEEMEKYKGKVVRFKGLVAMDNTLPPQTFVLGRHIMTCCVEDIQYSALVCRWPDAGTLKKRDWVTVTASIDLRFTRIYGKKGPVLTASSVERAEKPEEEVATYY